MQLNFTDQGQLHSFFCIHLPPRCVSLSDMHELAWSCEELVQMFFFYSELLNNNLRKREM